MKGTYVTRAVRIPDPLRISRYQKSPELGPRMLFFSGGSALNEVSRVLKNYTHNSIHLVTPFDSGGSSAKLRQAFDMPSIGDLRSRLIALADETVTGHPEVYDLLTYRFSGKTGKGELLHQLESMIRGRHPLVEPVSNPIRRIIRNQLGYFYDAMPAKFDLRGASIGNLVLTGGYLNNHEHLDPIIFLFEKLVGVQGMVRAVVNDNYHLAAELEDGSRIVGQHLLTGKEVSPLESPVKHLCLSRQRDSYAPVESQLRKKNHKLIQKADLIVYPPGSFYSSLVANLMPRGVGAAIAENGCPKVYVPNLGKDPEQLGMGLDDAVRRLLHYLGRGQSDRAKGNLLNFILLDNKNGHYPSGLSAKHLQELGIQVIDTTLVTAQSAPYYDSKMLVSALLSLT
ncbi:MAG: GAK system CofD-like protein [Candidatus Thiodiazotropha sp. (ex Ctena orbiculata)]|uniref:GAK system CofD-like protein n=1 Tax=Candidatus Thiodiazotropha taylori TaxID=2792791 RepID=A0A944M616_9GAMM|nr:GAK system CofD-like protein [Candidatus Thiodiazotropha taylori]MBT2988631.1 GAK system CofD-like protein [Candidatus Thiodiazotropha taylori]MBT2996800.1 GAK system CofD-like protein [Candidatus Thiodiazotropha taylori]MBT3002033.1 GAK system CofD-like protein [Candidatus Thiodiazotropha taylori]MBT3027129.1 GAK system CofD-like protein [Candidatus Thiodiazotropha taylori]